MTRLDASKLRGEKMTRIEITTIANGYILVVTSTVYSGHATETTQKTLFAATGDEVVAIAKGCLCGDTHEKGGGA